MSIFLAVLAAFANALSNVLQRKANREQADDLTFRLRLLSNLVRRPVWIAGVSMVIVSFLLMASALRLGDLATVEPVIVLELPLTILVASRLFKSRLHAREWCAIGVMTAGLVGLIACLRPTGGNGGDTGGVVWALATAATLGVIVALIGLGRRAPAARTPALLGAASGAAFGLTAAFMKGMTAGLDSGLVGVLSRWQTYAMVATGVASMYLVQHALHAGRLVASQPGITLADPLVAILWGALVFDEHFRHEPVFLAFAALSACLMVAASVMLARSPLLQGEGATTESGRPAPTSASRSPHPARQSGAPATGDPVRDGLQPQRAGRAG